MQVSTDLGGHRHAIPGRAVQNPVNPEAHNEQRSHEGVSLDLQTSDSLP
jgi:hypothetical protein